MPAGGGQGIQGPGHQHGGDAGGHQRRPPVPGLRQPDHARASTEASVPGSAEGDAADMQQGRNGTTGGGSQQPGESVHVLPEQGSCADGGRGALHGQCDRWPQGAADRPATTPRRDGWPTKKPGHLHARARSSTPGVDLLHFCGGRGEAWHRRSGAFLLGRTASELVGKAHVARERGIGHLRQRLSQCTVEGIAGTGGVDRLHLFGTHAVVRLGIAAQVLFGMRDEHAHRAQGHHHRTVAGQLAAQRVQAGTVQRGNIVGVHALTDVAAEQGGELGLVRGAHIGQRAQADGRGGIGRRGVEHGGDTGLARGGQRSFDGRHRRLQLHQHHLGAGQQRLRGVQEVGAERGIGARADHDGVPAAGVDLDARAAGRLAAGFGDQPETIVRGQFACRGATGVIAQRAHEVRVGAGAAGRHGLVEALASGAGAVAAGNGRTRCRQRLAPPHGSTEVRQHAGDGRRHEGGNGTAQHRAQAELGQVVATFRGQATDAADLDRDRAEVGEAAQRVGGDQAALATNSLITTFWPISEPTVVASAHGVPITQAIGAST
ncbi:hypothetical protein G6F50_012655 [Rhizopus delemar]|uniref:Uncharacterized protein n=1 Tax=Rhizopus delemar TaxID=936053 RepID=A0A9P7CHH6_9FUNG|nr:hypothetical protein G6F50_012655 [Rhizopus delemar]